MMMKKVLTIYGVFLILIWSYFMFFYPLKTLGDSNYGALAHAVFFSKLPLEWILLYGLIKKGWSSSWVDGIEHLTRLEWLKTALYAFLLVLCYGLIRLPFNLLWFQIAHKEGTSHQPLADWFMEMALDLFFYWIILAIGLYVIRVLMAKFKRFWWFLLWLLALPVAVFVIYIQPVWIDPLYEDFTQLEEGSLRTAIEKVTADAGIENPTILQVNMSEKVTTFNAYVTGIMGNARIVLWDTTLEGMEQDEILFILAHEIGHYVKHHVYFGVGGYLVLNLVLFYITAILYKRIWLKLSEKSESYHSLRVMPILLLTLSILLTISQPISMYVSRQMEVAADRYAVEHTENLEPAINTYISLATQSKGDINPVFWVKWIRFGHPPIAERIELIEKEIEKRETKSVTSP